MSVRLRWFPLTSAAALVLACGDGPFDPINDLPRPLSVAEGALVEADNRFAFKLFREIARQDTSDGNLFVSPLSVAMALGMAYNGTAGTTRDAMQQALELQGLTIDELNTAYRSLIDLLRGLDTRVEFTLANSIWHDQTATPLPAFVDATTTYFDATVQGLDFRAASAAPTINQWVSDATRGKIEEIVDDPIPWDVIAYLINAIYFKGDWTYQFDESLTAPGPFDQPDGSTVEVQMMAYGEDTPVRLSALDGYQILDLAYGGQAYSMTIVLPPAPADAVTLAQQLTQDQWNAWVAALDSTARDVRMPRYTLEWEDDLKNVLSTLGMAETFCPNPADLTNMFEGVRPGDLCFTEVKHKTFIDVNEEGTEAAAVTSVGVGYTSTGPQPVVIDRPFLFAIRERFSGTILFMGRIVDPR
ncbi:MAG: serpin family protein [Gemmatimonadales bacterium]|jgi:serpin B